MINGACCGDFGAIDGFMDVGKSGKFVGGKCLEISLCLAISLSICNCRKMSFFVCFCSFLCHDFSMSSNVSVLSSIVDLGLGFCNIGTRCLWSLS